MVGRLVHHQAAAVGLVAVPAAEVVRAVAGVEQPLEVDAGDLADDAGLEHLLDLAVARRIAVVEGDGQLAAGPLLGVDDLLALLDVDGHRFFTDDVAAEFHRAAGVLVVGAVHAGDDDHIGFGLGDHPVELVGLVGRHIGMIVTLFLEEHVVVVVHAALVAVAEPNQFGDILVGRGDRPDVHAGTTAGSNHGITFLTHLHVSFVW